MNTNQHRTRIARRLVRPPGFTLIEVLTAVAIIALLLAILLPALSAATRAARGTACLSNLRQFAMAAHQYADAHKMLFPISQYSLQDGMTSVSVCWDVISRTEWKYSPTTGWAQSTTIRPGLVWHGVNTPEINRCPEVRLGRGDNWAGAAYTGYNYNTSYIGHGEGEFIVRPASVSQVRRPAECALFGDGEYSGGVNKFMRSPYKDIKNGGDDFDGRSAGTQGYRHTGRTNVAFVDGHAVAWLEKWTETYPNEQEAVRQAKHTGFLSQDNRLYDLK
ncbi:MAG TPA: DUF1559 domain-containing protein [Phycisphaerae bacterium]|nr:DUF1559 domain-containing protein [Phycisphaerae bacterium]HOJ73768.1 DUF1559 domain-containing protein [Phycisphaerae bacterium]HOM50415.1 DUF1559 domain-containing protein [Phycisphaerae bacterium]HON65461.1 DUF1559 domain-containing protein [Phycisphaerae bacterium]HOQ84173.1 DUF1559 domain-containing protein [Phycisphaerae bacterium]